MSNPLPEDGQVIVATGCDREQVGDLESLLFRLQWLY